VILGGIEASLRRLAHYDYWSDTVRRSIVLDAKADLLIYGMAERQIIAVMARLAETRNAYHELPRSVKPDLSGIRGTVWAGSASLLHTMPNLPSYDEIRPNTDEGHRAFARSFLIQYRNTDPYSAVRLVEPYGDLVVVQEPPAFPLSREELDQVYALPFTKEAHPMYRRFGGVPALSEVKFSLVSSRGCFGGCSFCSLAFHEGRIVTSRSIESIVQEAKKLTTLPDFKGYIHDVGGPTANFRKPACAKMAAHGACTGRNCLAPKPCPKLEVDHTDYKALLSQLRGLPGVKRVFIRSGIRYDYLMLDEDTSFFHDLVAYHVSGQLKVAPEHVSPRVLVLMGKPSIEVFDRFAAEFSRLNQKLGKKQYLIPYFISGHPGATLEDALELARYLTRFGFVPDQVQDFYPTPGTLSTAMWWTGLNPLTGKEVYIPRSTKERSLQRALLQFNKPENRSRVLEALHLLGREDLKGELLGHG